MQNPKTSNNLVDGVCSDSTTGVAAPPDHNLAGTLGTSTETPREMGGSADVLATPTVSATNAPGISLELRRLRKRFDRVHTVLLSYMGHLMRKHHQGGALDVLLSELAPGHGICIADYLMKQLLRTYRQVLITSHQKNLEPAPFVMIYLFRAP